MTDPKDAASDFEELERLGREIEDLAAQKLVREQSVRKMRDSEDLEKGVVFAQEIFQAQQECLRLEVEMELRRKKINRIRLARDNGWEQ